MATECEADIQVKVATAKLSVAEALRIPMSCLAGLLAHAYTDSWLISIVSCIAVLWIVPYWYGKEYDAAWDEYSRMTGTGKYWKPAQSHDAVADRPH